MPASWYPLWAGTTVLSRTAPTVGGTCRPRRDRRQCTYRGPAWPPVAPLEPEGVGHGRKSVRSGNRRAEPHWLDRTCAQPAGVRDSAPYGVSWDLFIRVLLLSGRWPCRRPLPLHALHRASPIRCRSSCANAGHRPGHPSRPLSVSEGPSISSCRSSTDFAATLALDALDRLGAVEERRRDNPRRPRPLQHGRGVADRRLHEHGFAVQHGPRHRRHEPVGPGRDR